MFPLSKLLVSVSISFLYLSTTTLASSPSSPSSATSTTTNNLSSARSAAAVPAYSTSPVAPTEIPLSEVIEDLENRPVDPELQLEAEPLEVTSLTDSETSSSLSSTEPLAIVSSNTMAAPAVSSSVVAVKALPDAMKLLIGAGGIYAAFLYYGSLQEDVFRYTAADGTQFKQAWFLQVLEALANVIVGFIGMQYTGPTKGIPLRMFGISGATQVAAKACTSLALANGLSFPVATLAKSGKMAPVMAGSLLLGGASYTVREYLQVAAIIGGTAIVSMGKKKGSSSSSLLGVFYILSSLALDGVTAGFQKRLKVETSKVGVKPKPYDFMYWTNLFMFLTALVIAALLGELHTGVAFCLGNPEIMSQIIKFAICSAVGQSFIFYTIANFDPLVLSTVTTTRKIFSVLLSIFLKGHKLSLMGWSGVTLACLGILSEMQDKMGPGGHGGGSHGSAAAASGDAKKVNHEHKH